MQLPEPPAKPKIRLTVTDRNEAHVSFLKYYCLLKILTGMTKILTDVKRLTSCIRREGQKAHTLKLKYEIICYYFGICIFSMHQEGCNTMRSSEQGSCIKNVPTTCSIRSLSLRTCLPSILRDKNPISNAHKPCY